MGKGKKLEKIFIKKRNFLFISFELALIGLESLEKILSPFLPVKFNSGVP